MKQLTVFLATLLGLTVNCSVAYPSRKPAARVSKISFFCEASSTGAAQRPDFS
jgi:hypothetical protein